MIERRRVLRAPCSGLRHVERNRFPGALPRQALAPVVQFLVEEQLHVFRAAQQTRLMGDARREIGIGFCHTGVPFG